MLLFFFGQAGLAQESLESHKAAFQMVERAVKTGLREGGRVEILEGVKAGETVATSGLAQLYDGASVTVTRAPAGSAAKP